MSQFSKSLRIVSEVFNVLGRDFELCQHIVSWIRSLPQRLDTDWSKC